MPTYEYLCRTCSHRFEQWQKITEDSLTICPECGGSIRRVLFPAGVVFKGSGFYSTDHRNGTAPTASSNGSSGKDDQHAASDKKDNTESKPTDTTKNSSENGNGSANSAVPAADHKIPAAT